MRVTYIAHPLSAPTREGIEENRRRASLWAAWAAVSEGVSPVCSWVVLTGVLPETAEMRALGLAADCAQVERCDEIWYVGGRISEGMRIEGAHGVARGVVERDLTHLGELPPAAFLRTVGALDGGPRDREALAADEWAAGRIAGIEIAAACIENHSCVSSCCDAQPATGDAKALADCIRRLKGGRAHASSRDVRAEQVTDPAPADVEGSPC